MLLLDFSSIVITSTIDFMNKSGTGDESYDKLIRHVGLSQLLLYKQKFKEYGKPIICMDSTNYWRKDVFPNFKQNRKKSRNDSAIDWNAFFKVFNAFKLELEEHFPYVVIEVPRVEADDSIAVLARETDEDVMIVSSDKDMLQLQAKYGNRIKQWSVHAKKELTLANKDYCLMTHIIKGDVGDGIPNILSDDDVFLDDEKRQKSVYKKFIDTVKSTSDPLDVLEGDDVIRKFERNRKLIDVDYIPDDVVVSINQQYSSQSEMTKASKIYPYLVKHRMKLLLERIGDF
jgi:5'-3' exonuclease